MGIEEAYLSGLLLQSHKLVNSTLEIGLQKGQLCQNQR